MPYLRQDGLADGRVCVPDAGAIVEAGGLAPRGRYGMAVLEGEAAPAGEPGRRRYDSPVRRERAALTRQRIVDAGVELVRELSAWDWRVVTFTAVASRAGVGVRTVYRHFPTEHDLHGAILARLQEQVGGVTYEGLTLETFAAATTRMHTSLSSLAVSRWTGEAPAQPALAEVDLRRRAALTAALAVATRDWAPEQRQMAAGILDVLWNPPSYERLRTWDLEAADASSAITWAIGIVIDAIRAGHRPE
jgi:AcrR family transcriptional regulator